MKEIENLLPLEQVGLAITAAKKNARIETHNLDFDRVRRYLEVVTYGEKLLSTYNGDKRDSLNKNPAIMGSYNIVEPSYDEEGDTRPCLAVIGTDKPKPPSPPTALNPVQDILNDGYNEWRIKYNLEKREVTQNIEQALQVSDTNTQLRSTVEGPLPFDILGNASNTKPNHEENQDEPKVLKNIDEEISSINTPLAILERPRQISPLVKNGPNTSFEDKFLLSIGEVLENRYIHKFSPVYKWIKSHISTLIESDLGSGIKGRILKLPQRILSRLYENLIVRPEKEILLAKKRKQIKISTPQKTARPLSSE